MDGDKMTSTKFREFWILMGEYIGEYYLSKPFYSTVLTEEKINEIVDDYGKKEIFKKTIKVIEYSALEAANQRIAELEAELKNKDAVRLWNECEKLREQNRILIDGISEAIRVEDVLCEANVSHILEFTLAEAKKVGAE